MIVTVLLIKIKRILKATCFFSRTGGDSMLIQMTDTLF